jgi:thiol-disulfide isomerase/thioredoxin
MKELQLEDWKFEMKKIVIAVFLFFLLASPVLAALKLNDSAPTFSLPDSKGKDFYLGNTVGVERREPVKGIIVSFFATWCIPCRSELPLINAFTENLNKRGIKVVLINVKEDFKTVNALLTELKVDKPLVLSDRNGTTSEKYQVRFLPTTFFIDADGKIRDIIYGGIHGEKEMRESVQKLLRE